MLPAQAKASREKVYMEENSLLAEVPREGETIEDVLNSVDKELQVETPTESQTEKPIEKLELPDEEILKKNRAWEEMREARELAEARALDLEQKLSAIQKEESSEKSEFVASLVGDNEDVEAIWAKEKERLKEEMKREIVQEQLDIERKAKEQEEHWTKWTQDRLTEVEKEFNVDFNRDESKKNELYKIMRDFSPTDEQGNLDYRKGMKIYQELNKTKEMEDKSKTQVKKDIADATVSKETSVNKNKGFLTSQDLRGKDWRSLLD